MLRADGRLIGLARLITDYGITGLIADVMVDPQYQRKGFGDMLVKGLLLLEKELLGETDSFYVNVLASRGNDSFYKQMGFMPRPNLMLGPGMTMKMQGNKKNTFEM